MTLEQLRVLVAVVEAKSFKKAAKILNRSQPAVSVSIKNLEEELGLELFSRSHYRAVMMEGGRAFFEEARKLVADAERLASFGKYLAQGYENRVSITVDTIYPTDQLSVLLGSCRERIQESQLKVNISAVKDIKSVLQEGADIAIGYNNAHDGELEEVNLRTLSLIPVCAPSAREASASQTIEQTPQIIIGDSSSAEKILQEYGVNVSVYQWRVADFATKKNLIKQGHGWGYLPQYLILEELEEQSLVRMREKTITQHNTTIKAYRLMHSAHGKISSVLWKQIRSLAL